MVQKKAPAPPAPPTPRRPYYVQPRPCSEEDHEVRGPPMMCWRFKGPDSLREATIEAHNLNDAHLLGVAAGYQAGFEAGKEPA